VNRKRALNFCTQLSPWRAAEPATPPSWRVKAPLRRGDGSSDASASPWITRARKTRLSSRKSRSDYPGPICGRPLGCKRRDWLINTDCAHMYDLFVRRFFAAGQDECARTRSNHCGDLRCRWVPRFTSCSGSGDLIISSHAISSSVSLFGPRAFLRPGRIQFGAPRTGAVKDCEATARSGAPASLTAPSTVRDWFGRGGAGHSVLR